MQCLLESGALRRTLSRNNDPQLFRCAQRTSVKITMLRGVFSRVRASQWSTKCVAACGATSALIAKSHTLPSGDDHRTFVPLPDPEWSAGDGGRKKPPEEYVRIAPAELAPGKTAYALLISAVVPRPVAFVSSKSAAGALTSRCVP